MSRLNSTAAAGPTSAATTFRDEVGSRQIANKAKAAPQRRPAKLCTIGSLHWKTTASPSGVHVHPAQRGPKRVDRRIRLPLLYRPFPAKKEKRGRSDRFYGRQPSGNGFLSLIQAKNGSWAQQAASGHMCDCLSAAPSRTNFDSRREHRSVDGVCDGLRGGGDDAPRNAMTAMRTAA